MARRLKLLAGLSTLALGGAVALGGCGAEGEGEAADSAAAPASADHNAHMASEGEGEGERSASAAGGESEGASAVNAATDNAAYIQQLLLMRGHLQAGYALYAAGDQNMAATHMKHPQDELYAGLLPAFEARGYAGFADALDALAVAVKGGAPANEVEAKLAAARAGIDAAVEGANATPRETLLAMAAVLRTAGEEFDIGVKDDIIVNTHEYQDAYGFMTTVVDYLGRYDGGAGDVDEAVGAARAHAATALEAAPSVIPPEVVTTSSETIYGAAARVEIIARGLA